MANSVMRLFQPFVNVIILAIVGVVPLWVGLDVQGQEIRRDEYLRFLPLKYPNIVRQTEASAELHLFGNTENPEYQDTNPVDGIDDHRHKVLLDLAVEFSPILVINSTMIPMDFRLFMEREEEFLLSVDKWNVSVYPLKPLSSETINWHVLSPLTSEGRSRESRADIEDRRLRSLLKEFDPFCPGEAYRSSALSPERAEHQVMFFDFPGDSEKTWKQEYENQISKALPRAYNDFAKVFVHPFVKSVRTNNTEDRAYEFVLQYWFFYPYNDGFNNHEGDWEHINVFIKPLNKLHKPLSEADVCRILTEGVPSDAAPDRPVIQKVDYYFHHKVITLDYTRPNVYQPWKDWEAEFKNTKEERAGEKWIWKQLRYRAYCDERERKINTHPIGFIGGDNVGIDQLMKYPGPSNQASNGTYPFRGRYKNVGHGGAAENISQKFDHREYFAAGDHERTVPEKGYRRGSVVGFTSPDRIEILPDGERIMCLVKKKENAQARRDWAWLVLPIRWGYPAVESPLVSLVDIVAHIDLGNRSVLGPSYNAGWNRSGDVPGFQVYFPHNYASALNFSWQDSIINPLGYLNVPVILLKTLPPLDISWRPIDLSYRALMQNRTFQPKAFPYRFLGMSLSVTTDMGMRGNFGNIMLNKAQIDDVTKRVEDVMIEKDIPGITKRVEDVMIEKDIPGITMGQWLVPDVYMHHSNIHLYLDERWVSENSLRVVSGTVYYDFEWPVTINDDDFNLWSINKVFQLRGDFKFYEYSGSLRYNLTTGGLILFLKGGYGWSLYRIENVSTNDVPLTEPNGPWINMPTLRHPSTFLPNTGHFGAGVEWVPSRHFGSSPFDIGIRVEAFIYTDTFTGSSNTIYIERIDPAIDPSGIWYRNIWRPYRPITQPVLRLGVTLSF